MTKKYVDQIKILTILIYCRRKLSLFEIMNSKKKKNFIQGKEL